LNFLCTVEVKSMTCQQDADLVARQHPIGMDLWLIFDL
jgi:hypothetical protein